MSGHCKECRFWDDIRPQHAPQTMGQCTRINGEPITDSAGNRARMRLHNLVADDRLTGHSTFVRKVVALLGQKPVLYTGPNWGCEDFKQ